MVGKTGAGLTFDGWIPIRVYWRDGDREPYLDWALMGEERFIDPFFDATIQRRLNHPFHQAFRRQTPIGVLRDWQVSRPGLIPSGFIFHMSRCGSTLVSQMLAALEQNVVLSEAAPLDSLLRAHCRDERITEEQRITWLQGMINALGQRRRVQEERLFVKFDCWNIAELPLIRQAFPEVPWIFIFREPAAVLASHLRTPGGWMFPAVLSPETLGFETTEVSGMPHDEYRVRALARICELALQYHRQHGGLLINYNQLPEAVLSLLPHHFGIEYNDEDLNRMHEAARYNAKMPGFIFEEDPAKRSLITASLSALIARWLDPLYLQLCGEYALR